MSSEKRKLLHNQSVQEDACFPLWSRTLSSPKHPKPLHSRRLSVAYSPTQSLYNKYRDRRTDRETYSSVPQPYTAKSHLSNTLPISLLTAILYRCKATIKYL